MYNKNTNRHNFDEEVVNAVWKKAQLVSGYGSSEIRKDTCGALMKRSEHGNTNSSYGWEVDHIKPVASGGSDALYNLQALQWENNRHKSDNYPKWWCRRTA